MACGEKSARHHVRGTLPVGVRKGARAQNSAQSPERRKQAFLVEPIDPLEGFPLDLIFGFPRSQPIDDFGFEQADYRLGQCIVIAVASVNFDAFMRFRSSPSQENLAENSNFKRSSFQRAEHLDFIILGFGLSKRAGRGALKLLKRPARFCRRFVAKRRVRPDIVVVVSLERQLSACIVR